MILRSSREHAAPADEGHAPPGHHRGAAGGMASRRMTTAHSWGINCGVIKVCVVTNYSKTETYNPLACLFPHAYPRLRLDLPLRHPVPTLRNQPFDQCQARRLS